MLSTWSWSTLDPKHGLNDTVDLLPTGKLQDIRADIKAIPYRLAMQRSRQHGNKLLPPVTAW